jgi:hypothetical protein
MKRTVKTKNTSFIHFASSKVVKRGFDIALIKLGVDNKWTAK